ncbi:MAG: 16S rRNA (guanine(966)-N(2))-methyltransferase RsmD [Porticoccaceae bacterium]
MSKARQRPQSAHLKTESQVRIIAGHWRGRQLKFSAVSNLRPTGNRIRETLFNWLQPVVAGSRCLDLFAGSGALGFEAGSRGAAHVTLVESHINAVAALKENQQALTSSGGDETVATELSVIHGEALNWLNQYQHAQNKHAHTFDIVFLDPPFAMTGIDELAAALESSSLLAKDCWIYLESSALQAVPRLPGNWHCHREKAAGEVCYRLYRRG